MYIQQCKRTECQLKILNKQRNNKVNKYSIFVLGKLFFQDLQVILPDGFASSQTERETVARNSFIYTIP